MKTALALAAAVAALVACHPAAADEFYFRSKPMAFGPGSSETGGGGTPVVPPNPTNPGGGGGQPETPEEPEVPTDPETPPTSASLAFTETQAVVAGVDQCRAVSVANSGGSAATGLSFAISGTNRDNFRTCSAATTCGTSLAAGQSCDVGVSFSTAWDGSFSAVLTASHQGGSATTALTATASGVQRFRIFSLAGQSTFTPPVPNLEVRVLVVGGGNGAGDTSLMRGGYGGRAGTGTFTVNGPVTVTVGSGGLMTASGSSSSFGSLLAAAGGTVTSGTTAPGGRGSPTYNGSYGQDWPISGSWGNLSMFTRAQVGGGSGGNGRNGKSNNCTSGTGVYAGTGGGGGVVIGSMFGNATRDAADSRTASYTGDAGSGYGAGGGGACARVSGSLIMTGGGRGSDGVVYVEW